MIGKSLPEYIFIRLSIIALRAITPASAFYLALSAWGGKFLLSPWLGLVTIPDVCFYLLVYLPRSRRLQKQATHVPPPLERHEREELFNRCLNHITDADYPAGWFLSPGMRRENVIDWILWSLFSSKREDALDEWNEELDGYVSSFERLIGRTLENGCNKDVKSMRLTFDPVRMLHRPLVWYAIVGLVDTYSSLSMMSMSFKHYTTPKWFRVFPPRPLTLLSQPSANPYLPYWYRPHRSNTRLPVLFIHGVGIGLYPYIPLIRELVAQDPEVGILVIELLPICMRITSPPIPRPATCLAISQILSSLQISRIVLAAHSYGTVVAAHMHHSPSLSPLIAATLFIDPIPFLLHLPNVAFNFIYRQPKTANEWQLWYFACRDPDISRALSRHFFWAENILWKEELDGKKVAVSLSGADQVVHTQEVRRYLTGEEKESRSWAKDGLEVLFYPDLDHATVFDTAERRRPLLDILDRFTREDVLLLDLVV